MTALCARVDHFQTGSAEIARYFNDKADRSAAACSISLSLSVCLIIMDILFSNRLANLALRVPTLYQEYYIHLKSRMYPSRTIISCLNVPSNRAPIRRSHCAQVRYRPPQAAHLSLHNNWKKPARAGPSRTSPAETASRRCFTATDADPADRLLVVSIA